MLLIRIFSILFPIFFIVFVGYLYARYRPTDMSVANRLNIEVFTPCLLFGVLSDKTFRVFEYAPLSLAGALIVLGSGVIGWILARIFKLHVKTFVPPVMFTNTGNMGIPLIIFALGESALQIAIILFLIENILHFTLGMYIMNRSHWLSLFTIPIIWATLAGLLVSITQMPIPELLLLPIKMLGQISIPLMLFALGVRLTDMNLNDWKIGLLGAVACPVAGVIIFALISPWFNLSPLQLGGLLLFATLPPAVLNYVIAEQYQQEPQKVAAIVMLGNLITLISLPTALAFALPTVT